MVIRLGNIFKIKRESQHYREVQVQETLDERPLTEQEVKDRIQYWHSKWCNSIMTEDRQVYYLLTEAYEKLYKLKFNK
ncbi:MAG: hypothetical protein IKO36_00760 [Bacteroidaceae bacterium]|nr:hypothetical protein [Bacteroidaceae bacterium]